MEYEQDRISTETEWAPGRAPVLKVPGRYIWMAAWPFASFLNFFGSMVQRLRWVKTDLFSKKFFF